jgi:hypothetical protein
MTKIIAFAGRKQSGKTTCSWYIENLVFRDFQQSHSCKIYNFADPLKKDICMNILGLSYDQCYGEDIDKNTVTDVEWNGKKLTAREVMQFVGTDLFRKMKHDVWSGATIIKINNEQPSIAVVADCRFPNEVDAIKNAGGYVIKLTRDPFHSDHASETALDSENYDQSNFDLIIHNEDISIDEQNQLVHNFLKNQGILPL